MADNEDSEYQAIKNIVSALEPLDVQARQRVLDYVFKRLGIAEPVQPQVSPPEERSSAEILLESPQRRAAPTAPVTDIRSLKEQKKPRSANQMAALVAYYLAELAPPNERKSAIGTPDIRKYFLQASFPLPRHPQVTLTNARNAGYFDPGGEPGLFKLNPVGYNLVVHGLPEKAKVEPKRKRTPRGRAGRKKRGRAVRRRG
jgi:hypothetical protein